MNLFHSLGSWDLFYLEDWIPGLGYVGFHNHADRVSSPKDLSIGTNWDDPPSTWEYLGQLRRCCKSSRIIIPRYPNMFFPWTSKHTPDQNHQPSIEKKYPSFHLAALNDAWCLMGMLEFSSGCQVSDLFFLHTRISMCWKNHKYVYQVGTTEIRRKK